MKHQVVASIIFAVAGASSLVIAAPLQAPIPTSSRRFSTRTRPHAKPAARLALYG
jgi:hypothetical protein